MYQSDTDQPQYSNTNQDLEPKPSAVWPAATISLIGNFQQVSINGVEFWVATRLTIQQLISQQNQQANKLVELTNKLSKLQQTVDQQANAIQRLTASPNKKATYD